MEDAKGPIFDEAIREMLDSLKDEDQMTEKQRRILESAIKLFAEKGFHGSSTSEIARDAGVAEGTIFRHFKTKKDLLYALIAPMLIKFASPLILKDVKKIMNTDLPADKIIENLYRNRLELVRQNWPRMRIIIQEAQFHPEIADALLTNIAEKARKVGDLFVRQRIKNGEFRELPVQHILRAIFSTLLGHLFFTRAFPDEFNEQNEDENIKSMIDILLYGIKKQ